MFKKLYKTLEEIVSNKKTLKQLQEVQSKIRSCYVVLEKSKPPVPASLTTKREMLKWLNALFSGYSPSVDVFVNCKHYGLHGESIDYVNQLGHYFVNIAFYYKEKEKYETELIELQLEERRLKDKLGIN